MKTPPKKRTQERCLPTCIEQGVSDIAVGGSLTYGYTVPSVKIV